jgi:hypothetical protein
LSDEPFLAAMLLPTLSNELSWLHLQVVWAPLLGGLSVLFDEFSDSRVLRICLQGFAASCSLTAQVCVFLGCGHLKACSPVR